MPGMWIGGGIGKAMRLGVDELRFTFTLPFAITIAGFA
jgi:hypothetical protein